MKNRLLFLGPPGAGKGTQASLICNTRGMKHLSTGDLLRAEVSAKSNLGKEAEAIMNRGDLVSDELVLAIVENQLKLNSVNGWILDGFPRTLVQASALEKILDSLNMPIESVISLVLDDSIILGRLLSRGRNDDNESVILKRLRLHREKTEPLISFYEKKGILKSIEAGGTIEEISAQIVNVII